jgi:hypothetical protein
MKLHRISIKRAAFDKIPVEERTLLVLLAHAANELNILAKLFQMKRSVTFQEKETVEESKPSERIQAPSVPYGQLHSQIVQKIASTYDKPETCRNTAVADRDFGQD